MVAFAGEHCHPSFYSTAHGAYLTGRSAAQFFYHYSAPKIAAGSDEDVYNLGEASVADLSSWLEEVSMGEKNIEDYKHTKKMKPICKNQRRENISRDGGVLSTPR